jgi:predicted ATP-grasp superfamily ATP-dependent carboligase
MLESILNKANLYRVAGELDIPFPATAWIDTRADLERVSRELMFPVIAKPVYSTQWRKKEMWDLVGRQKAAVIDSFEELRRFHARIETIDPVMHVQEFVPGPDTDLVVFGSYMNARSGVSRYFTGRKVLQYPAGSGTGVAVAACPVADIVEPSRRLIERLGYSGVSEIEYKYDRRTGRYVLIEMNPRFWDQHCVGAAAGVNLAQCVYIEHTTGEVPEQIQSSTTVTWLADDGLLTSLVSSLRHKTHRPIDFLQALSGRSLPAVFDWKDMRPAFSLAAQLARDAVSGAKQRSRITAVTRIEGSKLPR